MLGRSIQTTLFRSDPIARKTLRYAIGIALSIAIAFGYNWPLSFIMIILANTFLMGTKPTFKSGLSFIVVIGVSVFAGVLLSNYLLSYKFIYLMVIGTILLNLYHADKETLSPILKIFLIIFILVIPLISLESTAMGSVIGVSFIVGGIVALLITWFVFSILPDLEIKSVIAKTPEKQMPRSSSKERFNTAVRSIAVVFPVLVLFYFFNLQNGALILIYVGMYSSFPGFAKDFTMGKGLLLGCISGGIIAFLLYELVVMVPMFSFLILIFFGISLWMGNEIFTGGKYAAIAKAGFSTIIAVFGSAVGSNEMDAGGKIITRVLQITVVVIYMVLAFGLIEKLFPKNSTKK